MAVDAGPASPRIGLRHPTAFVTCLLEPVVQGRLADTETRCDLCPAQRAALALPQDTLAQVDGIGPRHQAIPPPARAREAKAPRSVRDLPDRTQLAEELGSRAAGCGSRVAIWDSNAKPGPRPHPIGCGRPSLYRNLRALPSEPNGYPYGEAGVATYLLSRHPFLSTVRLPESFLGGCSFGGANALSRRPIG